MPKPNHWRGVDSNVVVVIVGGEDEGFVNAKRSDALISQKTRTLVKKFG